MQGRIRGEPISCIRPSILQWRGLIEAFDQAGPVFKPPLAARADREMSCSPREQELPNYVLLTELNGQDDWYSYPLKIQ
jgi:hypothetical protein